MQARRRAQPSGTNSPSSSHPRWKAPSAMRRLLSVPAMRPPGSPRRRGSWQAPIPEPRGSAPRERDHRGGDHPVPSRTRQLSPPSPRVLQREAAGGQGVALAEGAFRFARAPGAACAARAACAGRGPRGRSPCGPLRVYKASTRPGGPGRGPVGVAGRGAPLGGCVPAPCAERPAGESLCVPSFCVSRLDGSTAGRSIRNGCVCSGCVLSIDFRCGLLCYFSCWFDSIALAQLFRHSVSSQSRIARRIRWNFPFLV